MIADGYVQAFLEDFELMIGSRMKKQESLNLLYLELWIVVRLRKRSFFSESCTFRVKDDFEGKWKLRRA
jgi:hypothetical protein